MRPRSRKLQQLFTAAVAAGIGTVMAVELDVAYVETPPAGVAMMMDLAAVGPDDYVIDLGTGDGRIAIAAALRGARAKGVDIDPARVREAVANAEAAGVADRVEFIVEDLFDTDLSKATVVAMYLNEEVNLRLRPTLLAVLEPGTRVVSHNFGMGDWQPDRHVNFLNRSGGNVFLHDIYLWVVPTRQAR
ncbi:MAG: 50S ribosomal protein L11 methyltransferase [Woeseiaceae bacterium]|nr:50S ribosomal protein L11 methyltransferase [Woeseiaceae bacterium]